MNVRHIPGGSNMWACPEFSDVIKQVDFDR